MSAPTPVPGLLSACGWIAFGAVLAPLLLPPDPAYRTVVVALAVVLFALALRWRRGAFVLAVVAVGVAGVSALPFGWPEPVVAGPIVLSGYLAGAALREIYDIASPRSPAPLLPVWRAFVVASTASALSALVSARTGYLLLRGVPPPRAANLLGEDAARSTVGIVAVLASLAMAAGMHQAAHRLERDLRGRRATDLALVLMAIVAGGVGLLQRLQLLPFWRAARWQEWSRAQATFTDPSAAGVAASLLIAPLLAVTLRGSAARRLAAGAGVLLLLLVLAEAGSRAGFIGALTASALFVLWALTRLVAGVRPGLRRRVVSTVGGLAILLVLAFLGALSWPSPGAERSALIRRIEASFRKEPTPAEKAGNRLLHYEASLALFREHPIVGIGLGGFRTAFPDVARELGTPVHATDHPPSLYLGTLAESGLAGTLVLVLLLAGIARGLSRSLGFREAEPEEALRDVGAASALVGLLIVFLFGSHLVYPEIAAVVGILTVRVPVPLDGRTARLLAGLLPVVLAGALVLLLGGAAARAFETGTPEAAFSCGDTAGLYPEEREPDGRAFRWTNAAAAWRLSAPAVGSGPRRKLWLSLPLKNARPDGRSVLVAVFWNDRFRGRVPLPHAGWKNLVLSVDGPGVLRLVPSETFRPPRRFDSRRLGIEVGISPALTVS